jgi:hypothetical protein
LLIFVELKFAKGEDENSQIIGSYGSFSYFGERMLCVGGSVFSFLSFLLILGNNNHLSHPTISSRQRYVIASLAAPTRDIQVLATSPTLCVKYSCFISVQTVIGGSITVEGPEPVFWIRIH